MSDTHTHTVTAGLERRKRKTERERVEKRGSVSLFMHNNNEYYTTSPKCNSV